MSYFDRRLSSIRPVLILCLLMPFVAGCAGVTEKGYWGAAVDWPDGQRLARSAITAVRSPHTWVPLAGAVVFGATDLDEEVSEWAARKTPLFGADAEQVSDALRNLATGSYLLTAVLVPTDSAASRASGLAVGLSTLAIERAAVAGLKELSERERPDGSDDLGFPSGHTSLAAATATMAVDNLTYADIPDWVRTSSRIGLYGLAAGTGWARVEAEKHYPSDVLAGYAIGSFLARFMSEAFLKAEGEAPAMHLSASPLPGGAALTLRIDLD